MSDETTPTADAPADAANGSTVGTEVAIRQAGTIGAMPTREETNNLYRLGKALAASGMFKDARQEFQAMAKLVLGRDLGLSATAAMTGIHIVEGRPELSANLQAQMIRTYLGLGGERYDYSVDKHDETACTITIYRLVPTPGGGMQRQALGTETFTIEDAAKAGLTGKDNWKKYPKNMVFARCVSNAIAFYCPEVTGGVRLYHEGEIEAGGGGRGPDFDARATAMEDTAAATPEADDGAGDVIQDAEVVADDVETVAAEVVAEAEAAFEAEPEPTFEEGPGEVVTSEGEPVPEPAPEMDATAMRARAVNLLLEVGERDELIEARLRGAGQNQRALANLIAYAEGKLAEQKGGK